MLLLSAVFIWVFPFIHSFWSQIIEFANITPQVRVNSTKLSRWYSIMHKKLCKGGRFWLLGEQNNPWYIQNPSIFRILIFTEPWHLENQKHIQNPKHIQNTVQASIMECFAKIVNGCNYFCDISFSPSLVYEINDFF